MTLEVEVTLDYATGEIVWPGKIRHGVLGIRTPRLALAREASSPEKYPCLAPLAV